MAINLPTGSAAAPAQDGGTKLPGTPSTAVAAGPKAAPPPSKPPPPPSFYDVTIPPLSNELPRITDPAPGETDEARQERSIKYLAEVNRHVNRILSNKDLTQVEQELALADVLEYPPDFVRANFQRIRRMRDQAAVQFSDPAFRVRQAKFLYRMAEKARPKHILAMPQMSVVDAASKAIGTATTLSALGTEAAAAVLDSGWNVDDFDAAEAIATADKRVEEASKALEGIGKEVDRALEWKAPEPQAFAAAESWSEARDKNAEYLTYKRNTSRARLLLALGEASGLPESQLAPHRFVVKSTPVLPPTRVDVEGGSEATSVTAAIQNGISSLKASFELQGPTAAIAGLAGGVVATGVDLLAKRKVPRSLTRVLMTSAGRMLGGGALGVQAAAGWQQEAGDFLESTEEIPEFKNNPKLRLGAAATYATLATLVDTEQTMTEIAAVLGIQAAQLKGFLGASGKQAIKAELRRRAIRSILKNPGAGIGAAAMSVGSAMYVGFKAEANNESTQGAFSAAIKKLAPMLTGQDSSLNLSELLGEEAGEQWLPGGLAGTALTGVGSAVRVVGEAALSKQLTRLQALHALVLSAQEDAKARGDGIRLRPPDMTSDQRRVAALYGNTAYIEATKLAAAVESLAAEQKRPVGDMAARLGVPAFVVSDRVIPGTIVPVSIHNAMTTWAAEGFYATGVANHLAADPDGPTANTQAQALAEAREATALERARQEAIAKQSANSRKLQQSFLKMTEAERQQALYVDDVSGALSSFALEDMAEDLAARGYVLTKWDHQGQKVANDFTTHVIADRLYQVEAKELSSRYEYVFKVGGSIYTAHKADVKQAEADTQNTIDTVGPRMPASVGLFGTAGEFVRGDDGKVSLRQTIGNITDAHRRRTSDLRRNDQWARRGRAPKAFTPRESLAARISKALGLRDNEAAVRAYYEEQGKQFAAEVARIPQMKLEPKTLPAPLLANWSSDPQAQQRAAERLFIRSDSALLTSRAFFWLNKIDPHKFTAAVDMRGLRDIDQINRESGDFVLQEFGAVVDTLLPKNSDLRVAHLHGDEYAISSNSQQALEDFLKEWKRASALLVFEFTGERGGGVMVEGLAFHAAVVEGDYDKADAEANRTKKLLDAEAEAIHARNQKKEGTNEPLEELPYDSKRAAKLRIRPLPAGARHHGGARSVGRAERAPAERVRVGRENLEGLAERIEAQLVDESAAAIKRKADEITAELRRLLSDDPSSTVADELLASIQVLTNDLLEEAGWRIGTAAIRTQEEAGVDGFLAWNDATRKRAEEITAAALRVEKRAADALRKAIKAAKKLVEAPVVEEYRADRAGKDALYRLHQFLVKGHALFPDGSKSPLDNLELNYSDFAAHVEAGRFPKSLFHTLKAEGRFAQSGGVGLPHVLDLMGIERTLTERDWADVMEPPTAAVAARRDAAASVASVAAMDYLSEVLEVAGQETIGQEIPVQTFTSEIKAAGSSRQQGLGGSPVGSIRRAANLHIAALRRGDISVRDLLAAERRAATKAILAAGKGDLNAAISHRQTQMAFQIASKEAKSALALHNRLGRLFKSLTKNESLRTIGTGSPTALSFIGGVLTRFGAGAGRFPATAASVYDVFAEVAWDENLATLPVNLSVVDAALRDKTLESLEDLTTEQAENLYGALRVAAGFARAQAARLDNIQALERENLLGQMEAEARANNIPWATARPEFFSKKLAKLREHFAGISRESESVFGVLGALSPTINRMFIERADAAVERHTALAKDVLGGYLDLVKKHGLDKTMSLPLNMQDVRSYLPERPGETRDTSELPRSWAISIALNAGNRGNLYWLLTQEKWSYGQVQDFLSATLTKEEWAFVEDVWAFMDAKMYPIVEQRFKERYHFSPPKVEAVPMWVQSLGRFVTGGYMPVRFDPNAWSTWRVENPDSMTDVVGTSHQSAVTMNKSFTHARQEFATLEELVTFDPLAHESKIALPLDLRLATLPFHLEEVIHYAAYEGMILDLWRLSRTERFQTAARVYGGPGAMKQVTAWIRDVAQGRADSWPTEIDESVRTAAGFATATTAAFVGGRLPIMAADAVNSLVPMLLKMATFGQAEPSMTYGPRALLGAYRRSLTDFGSMWREAWAECPAIRNMLEDPEIQKIRDEMRRVANGDPAKETVEDWVKRTQFAGFDYVSRAVATIVYHARVADAMGRGKTETEAKAEANDMLHSFIVSHRDEYKSALLRHHALLTEFTRFRSFFFKMNGEYMRRALRPLSVRMMRAFGDGFVAAGSADMAILVGAHIAGLAVTGLMGEVIAGNGPDDKEDVWAWSARKLLTGYAAAVPVYGLVADPLINATLNRPLSVRLSPAGAYSDFVGKRLLSAFDQHKATDDRVWAALAAILTIRGLPANQITSTGSYIWDVATGQAIITSWPQALKNGIYGANRRGTTPFDLLPGGK